MAGGNESPRQKMISMMYLVLTAMLALQVSNAILEKFQLLNNSLEQANVSANESNERTISAMKKAVEDAGGKAEYVQLLRNAEDVRKTTSSLIKEIDEIKNQIIQEAGGGIDPETGGIVNLAEEEKVAIMMVGPTKQGRGYDLKKKLNAFSDYLQKLAAPNSKIPKLALDAKDDPAFAKSDANTKSKDFVEVNFAQTPVPAALASLSQKQSEIRRLESEILDYLAQQVGAKEIKFDKIFAVVIPDSRTVVAGQKYHAEVAIGAYSSAITPRISINGSSLPVTEGKGVYEVTAQGGEYDKSGTLTRSYTATISYPKPDGTMETQTTEEKYTVLKPSVQLESASLPALYFRCANKLQTSSPGLGPLFKPSFGGSGAEFIPGGGGNVTVVPTAAKVVLDVTNDGVKLQSFPFNVRRVPKPTVLALANGAEVNENVKKRGMSASSVRTINMLAKSDEDFKNNNPDDAKFRVTSFDIFLARGTRPKGSMKGVSGNVNISQLAQQAESGDRYLIIVNKVERMNFKGQLEEVNVGEMSIEIPLN